MAAEEAPGSPCRRDLPPAKAVAVAEPEASKLRYLLQNSNASSIPSPERSSDAEAEVSDDDSV